MADCPHGILHLPFHFMDCIQIVSAGLCQFQLIVPASRELKPLKDRDGTRHFQSCLSEQTHRQLIIFIVDRSIPVGFERGEDHNVRDVIRLRRIIE